MQTKLVVATITVIVFKTMHLVITIRVIVHEPTVIVAEQYRLFSEQ
jgi:hypothetical protein